MEFSGFFLAFQFLELWTRDLEPSQNIHWKGDTSGDVASYQVSKWAGRQIRLSPVGDGESLNVVGRKCT